LAEVPAGNFEAEELPRMYSKSRNPHGTTALVSFKFFDVRRQELVWLGLCSRSLLFNLYTLLVSVSHGHAGFEKQ
jgi:hypothetical protein